MHQLYKTYSALAEEIKSYHSSILKGTERNSKVKEFYKGCQILFRPSLQNPKFLLIGFNPGGEGSDKLDWLIANLSF